MDGQPIPQKEQIIALLTGSVYDLACRHVHNPSRYNLKKYITVGRSELIEFLIAHPGMAEAYFRNHSSAEPGHDVERIWREEGAFLVGSMDHGRARWVRRFDTLPEAIAEHVLVSYGMH